MLDKKLPEFVLAKSTNPHTDGRYGRAGLRFTREWRLLTVGDTFNADNGEITAEQLAILENDSFLAVKPATAAEVERLQADMATHGENKDALIDAQRKQIGALEARLMKLELVVGGGRKGGDAGGKGGDAGGKGGDTAKG